MSHICPGCGEYVGSYGHTFQPCPQKLVGTATTHKARTVRQQKGLIADAADFVSSVLGLLEPGQSIQPSLLEVEPKSVAAAMRKVDYYNGIGKPTGDVVYFVRERLSGFIKIGYSSKLAHRMSAFMIDNPVGVDLLLTIPGDRAKERDLHDQFASARYRGEWFYPSVQLLEFISRHE